jgi:hypothetical protein
MFTSHDAPYTAATCRQQKAANKLEAKCRVKRLLWLGVWLSVTAMTILVAGWWSAWPIRLDISTPAEAAAAQVPFFKDLKTKLASPDVKVRIEARRFLGTHFDLYKEEALADLFSETAAPDYVVSLLHGLIAGIDRAAGGRLSPGQHRDLSVHLPYVSDRLPQIVSMTGDPHEDVQKQAQRLVERFPVDDFEKLYDELEGKFKRQCRALKYSDQLIKYASVLYYYNRIVQYLYEPEVTGSELHTKVDAMTRKAMRNTECLQTELRIDAAGIYFARAIVFDHDKESAELINSEIKRFKATVDSFGGLDQYYSQSHIETANDLQRKYAK